MKQTSNTKTKIAAIVTAGALLLGAAGATVGILLNRDTYDHGKQLAITQQTSNGISLNSTVATNEDGATVQRITAIVNPAAATNAIIDWSIEWGTVEGSWGTEEKGTVTDYTDVTPTSDGALTADISCEAPFGTQAIVTASVRNYSDINATCSVDYVQKYEGTAVDLAYEDDVNQTYEWALGSNENTTVSFVPWNSSVTSESKATVSYSDIYTVQNSVEKMDFTITYTANYVAALAAAGIEGVSAGDPIALPEVTVSENVGDLSGWTIYDLLSLNDSISEEDYNAYRTKLIELDGKDMFTITATVEHAESETTVNSWTIQIAANSVGSIVTSLELDRNNVRF